MKSLGELDRLVTEVLCAEDFSVDDLQKFSAAREAQRIDEWEDMETSNGPFRSGDGWHTSSVSIHVPCEDTSQARPECETPEFTIPGVFHRSLVDIVRTAFESPAALAYHLTPFKLYAQTSNTTPPTLATPSNAEAEPERVYSELYNSDAMNDEYERINASTARAAEASSSSPSSPPNPVLPTVENVIAAIMLWSDSTHLASFGSASLWPAYLYFGNQSKYVRGKPSEFAAHHLAYFPSVSRITRTTSLHPYLVLVSYQAVLETGSARYMAVLHPQTSLHIVSGNLCMRYGVCSSTRSSWRRISMAYW